MRRRRSPAETPAGLDSPAKRAKAAPETELTVPVQALAIGGIRILALPGEVFCRYGLALQKKWPKLIAAGCGRDTVIVALGVGVTRLWIS